MIKRNFIWLVIASLLCVFAPSMSAADQIHLTYWTMASADQWEQEFLDYIEAKHGIKVELVRMATNQAGYYDKLKVAITTGVGPDIFYVTGLQLPEFAGIAADLAPYIDRDIDTQRLFMRTIDGARYPVDGPAVWAMPINYVVSVLFYNKDLFADAGVAAPTSDWTWEYLQAISQKLTRQLSADPTDKIYGFSINNKYWLDMQPAILSNGGTILNAAHNASAINNPAAADTLQFFRDMVAAGTTARPGMRNVGAAFLDSGRVAMNIHGSYQSQYWLDNGINFGIAMLPQGTRRRVVYGASDMLAISAFSQNPEAAWLVLMESAMGRPPEFFVAKGWFPVEARLAASKAISEGMTAKGLDYRVIMESVNYMENTASLNWTNWVTAIRPLFDQVLDGKLAAKSAVEQAELIMNNHINQFR
ncbi:MAG TPA: sugar ABC transporter substrate-binding protein [Firmicutes bacterium]|jgi:multiple sugar transport system substrate-binding protein|nr:sugar ABC transporter substrate-binding protein [Bacillota bacterium]